MHPKSAMPKEKKRISVKKPYIHCKLLSDNWKKPYVGTYVYLPAWFCIMWQRENKRMLEIRLSSFVNINFRTYVCCFRFQCFSRQIDESRKWPHTVIFLVTVVILWRRKNVCGTYGFYPLAMWTILLKRPNWIEIEEQHTFIFQQSGGDPQLAKVFLP